jgi:hypothetical protein
MTNECSSMNFINIGWKVDVCINPCSSQDANDYIANGNKDSGLIPYANYCQFHLIYIILSFNNSLLHLTTTNIVKSSLCQMFLGDVIKFQFSFVSMKFWTFS